MTTISKFFSQGNLKKILAFLNKSKLFTIGLMASVFVFLGLAIWKQWDTIIAYPWRLNWVDIGIMILLHTIAQGSMFLAWHLTMRQLHNKVNWHTDFRIFSVSMVARRIPFPIWYLGSRLYLYAAEQVSAAIVLAATTIETVLVGLGGILCYVILLPWYTYSQQFPWAISFTAAGLIILMIVVRPGLFIDLINWLLRKFKPQSRPRHIHSTPVGFVEPFIFGYLVYRRPWPLFHYGGFLALATPCDQCDWNFNNFCTGGPYYHGIAQWVWTKRDYHWSVINSLDAFIRRHCSFGSLSPFADGCRSIVGLFRSNKIRKKNLITDFSKEYSKRIIGVSLPRVYTITNNSLGNIDLEDEMKKIKIAVVLAMIAVFLMANTVTAQYSGYSWYTAYQVVNMGLNSTTITIDYYDSNGVVQTSAEKVFTDVGPGSSRLVMQYSNDPSLTAGRYSAVISAGEPIAAIANQQLVANGSASYNPAPPFSTYSGESTGSLTLTLPSIMYNWYNYSTDVYIMNVGTADATNVDITYVPSTIGGVVSGASGVTDLNNTIKQYASLEKNQSAMASLGASSGTYIHRFFGSAVITSDQPIIAVVNQNNATDWKLMTYNAFHDGSTSVAVPIHMRGYYGYYSTIVIANTSTTTAANVQLTYNADPTKSVTAAGSTTASFTVTHSIDPQSALMLYDGPGATDAQSDLDTTPHNFTQFYGSVLADSLNAVPVVVQVNVEWIKTKNGAPADDQAGSYNGIPVSTATQDIVIPVILADYYGYYTNLGIMNTTGSDGTCTVTYTSDATYSSVPNHTASYDHPLPANGIFSVYEGRKGGQENGDINHDTQWRSGANKRFIGAASVHCTVNAVAYVNEESDILGKDSMYTFNTFNK